MIHSSQCVWHEGNVLLWLDHSSNANIFNLNTDTAQRMTWHIMDTYIDGWIGAYNLYIYYTQNSIEGTRQ